MMLQHPGICFIIGKFVNTLLMNGVMVNELFPFLLETPWKPRAVLPLGQTLYVKDKRNDIYSTLKKTLLTLSSSPGRDLETFIIQSKHIHTLVKDMINEISPSLLT